MVGSGAVVDCRGRAMLIPSQKAIPHAARAVACLGMSHSLHYLLDRCQGGAARPITAQPPLAAYTLIHLISVAVLGEGGG